jgi:high affinity sulfate transporter 1
VVNDPAQSTVVTTPGGPGSALQRWAPGLHTLRHYQREWLLSDIVAGLALTAMLIPVGMGYAEASGVPAINGLYASIVPLLLYAVFGPSRILVLGPDSALAAVIAAIILPLAGGSVERAVALAGALALLSGGCLLLISFLRLGLMADLFSKPIRIGFLNAIALTVIIGQLPKLFGFTVQAADLPDKVLALLHGLTQGRTNMVALAIGVFSLGVILLLKRWRPKWPGMLLAVVAVTTVSAAFDLDAKAQINVLGPMPQGLPLPSVPWVSWRDLSHLLPGAVLIALLAFAQTSVLSRALAARGRYRVSQDQEMLALGAANVATGLFQGFPISSSASRTPVAESAGSRTQLAGVVGALAIALLLIFAPNLLRALPTALLAAVVIGACLSFADLPAMLALYRQRRVEFVLAWISFLGVAFVGVIQGIVITIMLSLLVMFWNAWHPHFTTLVRVDGRKGYHDAARHPAGRAVPGLILFRWDAQLFFANAEIFRQEVLRAVEQASPPARWVVVVSEAITHIDLTATDALLELHRELQERGVELHFAGLKGRVKDLAARDGLIDVIGADRLAPTVGAAVNHYRASHAVDWKDWDEN